jgi:hypothetical protein
MRLFHFLEQSRIMPVDGVGQEAVQIPPVWIVGGRVPPSPDRHVTDVMISPVAHSDVQPTDPHALLPIDLA